LTLIVDLLDGDEGAGNGAFIGAASGAGPAIALAGSIDVREATLTPCRNVLRSILDVISQVQSSVGFEFEDD
jgi:hypothetical protein